MECEASEIKDTNLTSVNSPEIVQNNESTSYLGESSSSNTSIGVVTPCNDKQSNRRYSHKPRKCISKDIGCNLKKLMKKTSKHNKLMVHQNLETIFEEPIKTKRGDYVLIGLSKAKRSITFSQFVSKAKLKKRRLKAKKLKEKLAERKKMEDVENKLWQLGL